MSASLTEARTWEDCMCPSFRWTWRRPLRSLLRAMVLTLVGAFCAAANAQIPSKDQPLAEARQEPSVQPNGPSQVELDQADVDSNNWLTSNKGYLGYRYSTLSQITAQNVRSLKPTCSFE